MSCQMGSIKLNKWALKFEFRKSEKILPRDLSKDDILKILTIETLREKPVLFANLYPLQTCYIH